MLARLNFLPLKWRWTQYSYIKFATTWFHVLCIFVQESPPAWTQQAYRPPCFEYSFCCPIRVPPQVGYPTGRLPPLTRVPVHLSVPHLAGHGRIYPPAGPGRVPRWQGTPLGWTWQGNPHPPCLDLAGYPPPGVYPMAFWVRWCKALWAMDTPPQVVYSLKTLRSPSLRRTFLIIIVFAVIKEKLRHILFKPHI